MKSEIEECPEDNSALEVDGFYADAILYEEGRLKILTAKILGLRSLPLSLFASGLGLSIIVGPASLAFAFAASVVASIVVDVVISSVNSRICELKANRLIESKKK